MTALANGAAEIIPVAEIDEALAARRRQPGVLLAGERNGVLIHADLAGGIEFDLGNSPREFTRERVSGKTIVMTTTNGTRALRACAGAKTVLAGSFLGLRAIGRWVEEQKPRHLLLVCSGTVDQASYEDVLGAGALCEVVWELYSGGQIADSAAIARDLYHSTRSDLSNGMQKARNGRRLLGLPELRDDVRFCLQRDTLDFVAELSAEGAVRKAGFKM